MKNVVVSLIATAALALVTVSAQAGGLSPGAEPQVLVLPAPEPAMTWTGAYGGLIFGLGRGRYRNGFIFPGEGEGVPVAGEGDWDGSLYGIALGYNFQNGRLVYGGELTYSGASIAGSVNCGGQGFRCYGEISSVATLRGRVGYLVGPSTLIYGTAGLAMANLAFGASFGGGSGGGQSRNVNGYVVGMGAEYAVTDRLNIRGALLHYEFNDDTFLAGVSSTSIGGDLNQLELGIIIRF
jgi:outer membrane immunogenic protein